MRLGARAQPSWGRYMGPRCTTAEGMQAIHNSEARGTGRASLRMSRSVAVAAELPERRDVLWGVAPALWGLHNAPPADTV